MGLDSVDILIRVENAFGIALSDQEAAKVQTVGDLYNIIWTNIRSRSKIRCNSQYIFYKFRRVLAEVLKPPPGELKLEASPNRIIPEENRRKIYRILEYALELKLPDLVLSKSGRLLLLFFGISAVFGALLTSVILIYYFDKSKSIMILPILGILLTFIMSWALNNKRTVIKEETLRAFIERILALNMQQLSEYGSVSRSEMEIIVNQIIYEITGVPIREITADKMIVRDLGIS